MHDKHLRSRFRQGWLVALLIAATVAGMTGPASASGFRDFDAVTTVNERNVWKHMALIGDQYAIYNDFGLIEGPRSIRQKWPFLPEQFTHDVDSAGISFSGPGFRWRHTWTKDNQAIIFEDSGIVSGPFPIPSAYDGLSDLNVVTGESTAQIRRLAVRGGQFTIFFDRDFRVPDSPLSAQTFLPARFQSDLDDVSVELESNSTVTKTSYYKGNERIIFNGQGRILELVTLDVKWPFLNNWRAIP
ncbi:hypothetical protein DPM19_26335 [Actinomadura craniellae]|uniref:Outer membrane lipoprotein carrier protein LolA n=1 Tax=Actinomadura craniellae TaxID=2231787 RepID=A0A365GZP2_9ACTN|nr:hypothetical protein [Actinomadura craniellae]RAY12238.1 hypothetical protein DPM19_26335 [Actinomadura craniellae]